MHKLLRRQLIRAFGSVEGVPPGLEAFLPLVCAAYTASDEERAMYERSLEITSRELMAKNRMLEDERNEIREIIERVPEGLAIARDGRYLFMNSRWAGYLGYSPDELVGKLGVELAVPEDVPLVLERIRRAENTGSNGVDEIRYRRKDGGTVLLELSPAQRIRFAGQAAYVMGARDVTDRQRTQEQALLADRMASLGKLAAGIAHEINNPLSFVVSNLAFISREIPKGTTPEVAEALSDAREGAERVRNIVRDLKSFSRSDEKRIGPVSLRGLTEASVKLTMNEIRHRAKLVLDFRETRPALGNDARLGQVLVNLLVNAAHALDESTSDRNEIRVATCDAADRVCIEVSDNGCGIPESNISRIFDPFFTTKPVGIGTGLGLSICHGIVSEMGGRIDVDSAPGIGSTFRVSLPVAPAAETSDSPTEVTPVSDGRRARILVIDDEPMIGSSIRRMLREHEVVAMDRAERALDELTSRGPYDVILCDLMMPGMTGMDLFERVPECLQRRFVFISGGVFTPRAEAFLDRARNRIVAKPIDDALLREVVGRMVQAP